MFDFSEEELVRYSRHILLQDVGVEGQEKIKEANKGKKISEFSFIDKKLLITNN